MADADFLGVDKDEGTGTYRTLNSDNTTSKNILVNNVPLDPSRECIILAMQVILMYIIVLGNRAYDANVCRIRTNLSELVRLVIFICANYGTLRFLYKGFDFMSLSQFQAWIAADFYVTLNCLFIFVLLSVMLHLLEYGYSRPRQLFGLLNEVIREERLFVFIHTGFCLILAFRLLGNIFKLQFHQ